VLIVALFARSAHGQATQPRVHPVLRLEKPEYLFGEQTRFWTGMDVEGGGVVTENRKPCSLSITHPGGRVEQRMIGWPFDGMQGAGWTGGSSLSPERPGSFFLVMECGGERTGPVELIVRDNEVVHQITASFKFAKTGTIGIDTPVPVTLTVSNDSPYTIRFPKRGVMTEGIGVEVRRREPPSSSGNFYPWEELAQSRISFDTYNWEAAQEMPSVTLLPGEHFAQTFLLDHAFKFTESGEYSVSFSTAFSVLVGEKDGPLARACPVRLNAEGHADFLVRL